MTKYNFLKIKSLSLEGFRCFPNYTVINMNDITCVSGSNGIGKTSIAHAITYVFFGLSFFGEQNINMLLNNTKNRVKASVDFETRTECQQLQRLSSQHENEARAERQELQRLSPKHESKAHNNTLHTLTRIREGSDTVLTLDGIHIRQSDILSRFCDKDMFLSIFNPLYFIDCLGQGGRELIQKLLPAISREEVLNNLSIYEQKLLKDKDFTDAEGSIKKCREKIKQFESDITYLEGQSELLEKQFDEQSARRDTISRQLDVMHKTFDELSKKKFEGVDIDILKAEYIELQENFNRISSEQNRLFEIETKLRALNEKEYVSKYSSSIAGIIAEIKSLSGQYHSIKNRFETLQPGEKCPVCHLTITENNIHDVKNEIVRELQEISQKGKGLVKQRDETIELESKAKQVFEQYKADDITLLTQELDNAKRNSDFDFGTKRARLSQIERLLKHGQLSDDEIAESEQLNNEISVLNAELKAIFSTNLLSESDHIVKNLESCRSELKQNTVLISALESFVAKKAELSVEQLNMPNVEFKLFELIKSTGELKNVFKFTYCGRDYRWLSLSEKIRTGLEVSSLLRRLSGFDYPVFIDNTESITHIDKAMLPSQVILSKVVKDSELKITVSGNGKVLNNPVSSVKASNGSLGQNQNLKKAG